MRHVATQPDGGRLASAVCRTLLRLYPRDYRVWFGAEIEVAFDQRTRSALAELIGLAGGVCAEWAAKLSTDRSVRARSLPDLRMMRPPGVPSELYFSGAAVDAWRKTLPE